MAITPLYPEAHVKRPWSQAMRAYRHNLSTFLSPASQNQIRSQLSIADWLLIGCGLQALLVLISPLPLLYSLTPTFALGTFKILRTLAMIFGLITNTHMKGVRIGRQTAIFPNPEGGFDRPKGESVGGKGMCIILLSSKCNHPLGMYYPPYIKLAEYFIKMAKDLEKNAVQYGFLGYSQYEGCEVYTKPIGMNIMYFKSLEYLHQWANTSETHRAGWDWWNAGIKDFDNITIAHEVYSIPEGGFENIFINSSPYDFAATSHAIKAAGGEQHFVCPLVDANKGFRSSNARMGTVKV